MSFSNNFGSDKKMTVKSVGIPYGSGELSFVLPVKNYLNTVLPVDEGTSCVSADVVIKKALERPVGTPRLSKMVRSDDKIAVIVNDVTRPTPSSYLIPFVLNELKEAGVSDDRITFYVALGLHRFQNESEMIHILGEDIYRRFKHAQHEVGTFPVTNLGTTSRGTPIEIFSDILENDFIIGIGEVGFHYYAGYSGGSKSLLPGVSSRLSVIENHKFMIDKDSVSGRVSGPVRQDSEEAAGIIGLDFILNVVLDSRKKVIAAFAGDYIAAHRECVKVVDALNKVKITLSDAVIVSAGGYPKDINLYQTNKALENATQAVKEGGAVILVSECRDGIGNDVYDAWNRSCATPDAAIERFKNEFEFGGHKAAKTAVAAKRFKLYLVSSLPPEEAKIAFFTPCATVEEAIECVLKENPSAMFNIIPYGTQTLPMI